MSTCVEAIPSSFKALSAEVNSVILTPCCQEPPARNAPRRPFRKRYGGAGEGHVDGRTARALTTRQEGQIMANYRVISSDNHVFEPPDLWTSRAKPAFKDRVPQLVHEYDGDWWFCDGHRTIGLAAGTQTGMRFEAPEQMVRTTTFDKVRPGGYEPAEPLKDMGGEDEDVSNAFPTSALV